MLRKDPFITGEYYHIYNRGIDKRNIFKSQNDYDRMILLMHVSNNREIREKLKVLINVEKLTFSEILNRSFSDRNVSIGSWCLMTNHYHLILKQEADGGITDFMKRLGTGYSMYFNKKYQRTGALFGGLFKSKLIKSDDAYLRYLFSYVNLNPLDIKFPKWNEDKNIIKNQDAKDFLRRYAYSSYSDLVGIENRLHSKILKLDSFPDYFSDKNTTEIENFILSSYFESTNVDD